METARGMARGLAASGVIVASDFDEGIPTAVHRGILEAHGTTLAVTAGGLERCSPACCAPLHRRLTDSGVVIAESHPSECSRGWSKLASARTLALIAKLVIVVEAGEHARELACAQIASSRGRRVAAVPGRVSSEASKGTNSLLMGGVKLVRNPQDALDALFGAGARASAEQASGRAELEPHLAQVLERVGCGEDTIEKLVARGAEPEKVAMDLTELELRGRLVRGEGGRYLPSTRLATE
jgi:DNA processing protein